MYFFNSIKKLHFMEYYYSVEYIKDISKILIKLKY